MVCYRGALNCDWRAFQWCAGEAQRFSGRRNSSTDLWITQSARSGRKTMVDGEKSQLKAVGYAQLVEDVADMVFDRLLADRAPLRDVRIRVAGHHQGHNLHLAGRQTIVSGARAIVRRQRRVKYP